jgi:alcohol dehydrogenase class IV
MALAAAALGAADAPTGLFALNRKLGVPLALKEIGMPADGIDKAVKLAMSSPYWNPRPIEEPALRMLLQNAYEGRAPAA